eukprot:1161341-Pelagomonas_calceolata.AAC.6
MGRAASNSCNKDSKMTTGVQILPPAQHTRTGPTLSLACAQARALCVYVYAYVCICMRALTDWPWGHHFQLLGWHLHPWDRCNACVHADALGCPGWGPPPAPHQRRHCRQQGHLQRRLLWKRVLPVSKEEARPLTSRVKSRASKLLQAPLETTSFQACTYHCWAIGKKRSGNEENKVHVLAGSQIFLGCCPPG